MELIDRLIDEPEPQFADGTGTGVFYEEMKYSKEMIGQWVLIHQLGEINLHGCLNPFLKK
jgi:hypothetical protein